MRRARGTGALTPIIMMFITSLRSLVKGSRSSALVNMSARLSAVGTLFTARVLSASRSRTMHLLACVTCRVTGVPEAPSPVSCCLIKA